MDFRKNQLIRATKNCNTLSSSCTTRSWLPSFCR